MRSVLAGLVVVLSVALPPAAAAQPQAIGLSGNQVVSLGGWTFDEEPTLDDAKAVFGEPSSVRGGGRTSCVVRWDALRLRITFVDLGGGDDACVFGKIQSALLKGAGTWATPRGLATGDPSAKLRQLYPKTSRNRFKRREIDLHRARTNIGVTGIQTTVSATVSGGAVSSLVVFAGQAGD